jgi:NAD(P)H-dependent FMN reductase
MHIVIVSSSVRSGRNTHRVALHLATALVGSTDHTTDLLDLAGLEPEFVRDVPLKPYQVKFMIKN